MEENEEERQIESAETTDAQSEPSKSSGQTLSPDGSTGRGFPWGWIGTLIFAVAFAVMLTYTLTAAKVRNLKIQSSQPVKTVQTNNETTRDFKNMESLIRILKAKSFYTDSMEDLSGDVLLKAVVDAYIYVSGDVYAAYYTEEEYQALANDMAGNHVGIGVTITQTYLDLNDGSDEESLVCQIEEVYPGSGAEAAGLAVGEWIYAVKIDDSYQTVDQLGLDAAAKYIRGEAGTTVDLAIMRFDGTVYESRMVTVMRSAVTTRSVRLSYVENDPTVAVIRISEFDYTTPTQFAEAVETAKENGALHFVFDVRNNPGGEMSSIFAVLSNFLREGDLVLAMVDAKGNRVDYPMKPVEYTGDVSGCTVTKEQIGRYRDLDFVVLCDEDTASAAEVFTAVLRDFDLAKAIVGQTTFGKGIVQNYRRVELEGVAGYLKVTIAEYVTECGESYHGKGIEPTVSVVLPKAVRGKSTIFLPWEDDTQLRTAVAQFEQQ